LKSLCYKMMVLRVLVAILRTLRGAPGFLCDQHVALEAQKMVDDMKEEAYG
jgi:hypothetical protein